MGEVTDGVIGDRGRNAKQRPMVAREGVARTAEVRPTIDGPSNAVGLINDEASLQANSQRSSDVMTPSVSSSPAVQQKAVASVVPRSTVVA